MTPDRDPPRYVMIPIAIVAFAAAAVGAVILITSIGSIGSQIADEAATERRHKAEVADCLGPRVRADVDCNDVLERWVKK